MFSPPKNIEHFEKIATKIEAGRKGVKFYHRIIQKYHRFFIPENARVLEIGCSTGNLLASVKPSYGVGIDFSPKMVEIAKKNHPNLHFFVQDAQDLQINETFDFIILSDLVGSLWDVQLAIKNLKKVCAPNTRIIITHHNTLWEPFLKLLEKLHLKHRVPEQNWLSISDLQNFLHLEGFELIRTERKIMFPIFLPILSWLYNRYLSNLPFFRHFCMTRFLISRPVYQDKREYSVSIVVPARNEKGNIENAILQTPDFGSKQEFIFIEGHSKDGTWEEILRVKEKYPEKNIVAMRQTGKGKGNAVREAFDAASCDILMILDADLTTPPEDMPKFYEALRDNKGEFINGCRLVYPMEKQAMRTLNLIANKMFGMLFTYLLGQRLKDTLCGTKVLYKKDYEVIKENRSYFGDFDPFGDFDLLFGASKMNLKIAEINIRYKDRAYGSTQISRFRHGLLLIRMCFFAARKIKFV